MNTLVVNKLSEYLARFVSNYSKDQCQVHLLRGEINLEDFELNLDEINKWCHERIGFLEVRRIKCSEIHVKLPGWMSLKKKPVVIQVGNIEVVAVEHVYDFSEMEKPPEDSKFAEVEDEGGKGYGLTEKVLDGLRVEVESVKLSVHLNGLPTSKRRKRLPKPLVAELFLTDLVFVQTDVNFKAVGLKKCREHFVRNQHFDVKKMVYSPCVNLRLFEEGTMEERHPVFILQNHAIEMKSIFRRNKQGALRSVYFDVNLDDVEFNLTQNGYVEVNHWIASLLHILWKSWESQAEAEKKWESSSTTATTTCSNSPKETNTKKKKSKRPKRELPREEILADKCVHLETASHSLFNEESLCQPPQGRKLEEWKLTSFGIRAKLIAINIFDDSYQNAEAEGTATSFVFSEKKQTSTSSPKVEFKRESPGKGSNTDKEDLGVGSVGYLAKGKYAPLMRLEVRHVSLGMVIPNPGQLSLWGDAMPVGFMETIMSIQCESLQVFANPNLRDSSGFGPFGPEHEQPMILMISTQLPTHPPFPFELTSNRHSPAWIPMYTSCLNVQITKRTPNPEKLLGQIMDLSVTKLAIWLEPWIIQRVFKIFVKPILGLWFLTTSLVDLEEVVYRLAIRAFVSSMRLVLPVDHESRCVLNCRSLRFATHDKLDETSADRGFPRLTDQFDLGTYGSTTRKEAYAMGGTFEGSLDDFSFSYIISHNEENVEDFVNSLLLKNSRVRIAFDNNQEEHISVRTDTLDFDLDLAIVQKVRSFLFANSEKKPEDWYDTLAISHVKEFLDDFVVDPNEYTNTADRPKEGKQQQGVPEGKSVNLSAENLSAEKTLPLSSQAMGEGSVISSVATRFKSRELNLKQTKKIVEKIPPMNLWIYLGKIVCTATESLEEIIEGYAVNPQVYFQKTAEQAHLHIACREANLPKSPVGEWIQKDIGIKMSQINYWSRLSFEVTSGKDSEFPIQLNEPKFKHLFESAETSNAGEEKNAVCMLKKSFPSSVTTTQNKISEDKKRQSGEETEVSKRATVDGETSKSTTRENSPGPIIFKTPTKTHQPPTARAPGRTGNTQNTSNANFQPQQTAPLLLQKKMIDTPPLDDLLTKRGQNYLSEDKGTAQQTAKEYEEIIRDLLERNKFLAMRSQTFENDAIVAKQDFQTMVQRWTDEKGRILNATAQNQSRMFSEINLLTKQIDQLTERLEKEKFQTRMLTERIATTASYKM